MKYGLFDTTPLWDTLHEFYNGYKPERATSAGSVDADRGVFVRYTEEQFYKKSKDDFLTTILSSASIPTVFPHIQYEGQTLVDGGSMMNLDVTGAYDLCRKRFPAATKIVFDVLLCSGKTPTPIAIDPNKHHTLEMLSRYNQLNGVRKNLHDLDFAEEDLAGKVTFRYVFVPNEALPGSLVPLVPSLV